MASAVNRGGVRFEMDPTQDAPDFTCWARMRNHAGHGPTLHAAADALIEEITRELAVAQAARANLRAATPEPTEDGQP